MFFIFSKNVLRAICFPTLMSPITKALVIAQKRRIFFLLKIHKSGSNIWKDKFLNRFFEKDPLMICRQRCASHHLEKLLEALVVTRWWWWWRCCCNLIPQPIYKDFSKHAQTDFTPDKSKEWKKKRLERRRKKYFKIEFFF